MRGNRLTELWLFLGIAAACGLAGLLAGRLIEGMLAGVVIYTGWHIYRLVRLPAIIRQQRQAGADYSIGLWTDVRQALEAQTQDTQQQRQQLSLALDHLRNTVETLPDAVVILQTDNRIEWSNKAAETLIGICAKDARQPLDACVRDPLLNEYLQRGIFTRPLIMFAPADRSRTLSLTVRTTDDDAPVRVIVARDISQQYHLDKTKRDLVANISHELRTPLTVITGLLEQLEPEVADNDTGRRITGIMQNQAQRMRDLISDLLALARIESTTGRAQNEVIPIADMLASVIEEARTLSEQSGHVVLTEIQSGYGLRGNASELRTAFTNLVVNAIRHTPDRAEVRIRWVADMTGGQFSVRDSGAGIPARHIPRLTERFYRIDSSRSRDTGGTGLGLSIVKQVLDKHEAQLEITSETGQGSTFTCNFPSIRIVRLAE